MLVPDSGYLLPDKMPQLDQKMQRPFALRGGKVSICLASSSQPLYVFFLEAGKADFQSQALVDFPDKVL